MSLIQSSIQVSSSDIANAVFAELQQKFVNKSTVLKARISDNYDEAKLLVQTYINEEREDIIAKHRDNINSICDMTEKLAGTTITWLLSNDMNRSCTEDSTNFLYSCGFVGHELHTHSGIFCRPIKFFVNLLDPSSSVDEYDDEEYSIVVSGIEIRKNSREPLTNGKNERFVALEKSLKKLFGEFKALRTELNVVNDIIAGKPDPSTGLSLKDFVAAKIATQAVVQVPELVDSFNIDATCKELTLRLVGNY